MRREDLGFQLEEVVLTLGCLPAVLLVLPQNQYSGEGPGPGGGHDGALRMVPKYDVTSLLPFPFFPLAPSGWAKVSQLCSPSVLLLLGLDASFFFVSLAASVFI